ncbi:hypothetical protein [Parapedobacter sp. 2B3]|uniref:hypothetical protein n=1 Tax=Parapedobacter sp. 2B3 TaxID=3342381 RepID=UPI0035B59324
MTRNGFFNAIMWVLLRMRATFVKFVVWHADVEFKQNTTAQTEHFCEVRYLFLFGLGAFCLIQQLRIYRQSGYAVRKCTG